MSLSVKVLLCQLLIILSILPTMFELIENMYLSRQHILFVTINCILQALTAKKFGDIIIEKKPCRTVFINPIADKIIKLISYELIFL